MSALRRIALVLPALTWSAWLDNATPALGQPPELLRTFVSEFVEIAPGRGMFPAEFDMGSASGPAEEQPVRRIRLDREFRIQKFEVWQDLYQSVMGANPSRWKGPRNSAEMLSWHDARAFCEKITRALREAELIAEDEIVRLPTEAEWEYCCRAGTRSAYSFGESAQRSGDAFPRASLLDDYAWHTGNAAGNDPAVGAKRANPWGLFDMHGYLSEYCSDDWRADYRIDRAGGGVSPAASDRCVIRGGSWEDPFPQLRSSARRPWRKADVSPGVGFRCVISREPAP